MNRNVTEDIKHRLKLSELIAKDTPITRKANRLFALCPFHSEKSPSFTIDDEKGFYHCFGCGASGDHFAYVQAQMNMNFPQALEHLAHLAHVDLPVYSPQAQQQQSHKKLLFDIMKEACV